MKTALLKTIIFILCTGICMPLSAEVIEGNAQVEDFGEFMPSGYSGLKVKGAYFKIGDSTSKIAVHFRSTVFLGRLTIISGSLKEGVLRTENYYIIPGDKKVFTITFTKPIYGYVDFRGYKRLLIRVRMQ